MTPEDAAVATYAAVHDLPAIFMLRGATYALGAELGYEGIDFYVCGRGGPLGDVDADVVSAAFVFLEPGFVREAWERGGQVQARRDAAASFLGCGYEWARRKLPADGTVDLARLAALLGRVVAGASPAGAPLFGALRAFPEPAADDLAALVLHRLDALRELRGALHGASVLAQGLHPLQAVASHTPGMAAIFGWGATPETTGDEALADRWQAAEAATNRAAAAAFAVLDAAELEELAALCAALSPPAPQFPG